MENLNWDEIKETLRKSIKLDENILSDIVG